MPRNPQSRRAANAVEFALTFPVLLVMMAAVVDWGWYFSEQMALSAAVRDVARIGAMTPREDGPDTVASEKLVERLVAAGHTGEVLLDVRIVGEIPDASLHVGVSVPYRGPVGIVLVPTSLRASQTSRLEDQGP